MSEELHGKTHTGTVLDRLQADIFGIARARQKLADLDQAIAGTAAIRDQLRDVNTRLQDEEQSDG